MRCPDIEQLDEYLRGDSPAEQGGAIAHHIQRCGNCEALAEEAAENLRIVEHLRQLSTSNCTAERSEARLPEFIGNYRIVGEIGRGGMGVVYRAEQENPRRYVALKVTRSERTSEEVLRRFEYEVQVLGRLQHPGIARIYEAGVTETSQGPQRFFAMEAG